ncbi:MAG: ATP-binding cassette domain-containing protein [Clostridia bacterium]|nr:ATP-binding cassette domain-containing protein [Clostridia bacterium]
MENFAIKNLSFTYPGREEKALDAVTLTVSQGEFLTLCGKSGCGKTTLLRLLKTSLSPYGKTEGTILFQGKTLAEYSAEEQAAAIGFVMQNPDHQIVTDKVWHELAFGLESLGYSTPEIRARVSEMASFFGIETWFYKNVTELSGGQKQLLNLASVMAMQPSVLILDEPTSQLDPIAAQEFLKTLEKINRDLGTTVILSEHRLEDAFPMSDRVVVLDKGKIIAEEKPAAVAEFLRQNRHDMYRALPSPMRIYAAVENGNDCPLTVREGRAWLEAYSKKQAFIPEAIPEAEPVAETDAVVEMKDVWFRYEKALPDVIKNLSVTIRKGELLAILGGNGTGKTTAISLLAGLYTPYRGEIFIKGKKMTDIKNLYRGLLGMLPQNPQSVFVKKTVCLDLLEVLSDAALTQQEKEEAVYKMAALCRIDHLLQSHPYDLSGGEQQRAALAKVLLLSPEILLLDEPTKGMDAHFKEEFADILKELKAKGITIVMVSHDVEFCAEFADRCALFFDGSITSEGVPRAFFAGKSFYTTSANRMARDKLPKAVLAEDVILACGKTVEKKERKKTEIQPPKAEENHKDNKKKTKKITPIRAIFGGVFAVLFLLVVLSFWQETDILHLADVFWRSPLALQLISIGLLTTALLCLLPQRELGVRVVQQAKTNRRLGKRTWVATLLVLFIMPLTIYVGIRFLGGRKYYFISLLLILETILPFCMVFESRKPRARELVVISVLCAISVAGRSAFFMLPQFKPVAALVILSGVCFGGETGFLVGAVTGFVSNFFFGQGPWTPWQMFALGMIGFLAGILFKKGMLRKTKLSLSVFGFLAAFIVYGGIMNPSSVIQMQAKPTLKMFIAAYISGAPFDLVHGVSTAFFLWFISEAMIDKLERIKIKYGLIER